MTDRTRIRIEIGLITTLVSAAAGGGAGLATFQAKLGSLESQFAEFRGQLVRIDQRVADIYCAQVPPEKRAGCR